MVKRCKNRLCVAASRPISALFAIKKEVSMAKAAASKKVAFRAAKELKEAV